MKSFISFLEANYSQPIEKLSKTDAGTIILRSNFPMIDLEAMGKELPKIQSKFRGNDFSSADSLLIRKIDDEYVFQLFEFKNLNFNNEEDKDMAKFHLKNCILKMEKDPRNMEYIKCLSKIRNKLVDKSHISFRTKPFESLSIIYIFYNHLSDDDSNTCKKTLSDIEKHYFIVSNSSSTWNSPFAKNKSNNQRRIHQCFKFLPRMTPYFYEGTHAISLKEFENYINNIENQCN